MCLIHKKIYSRKVIALATSEDLPEIPRILIFLFWSTLLHLSLFFVMSELLHDAVPASRTVLQIRLATKAPSAQRVEFPDLWKDALRDLESSLQDWTDIPSVVPKMADSHVEQEQSRLDPAVIDTPVVNTDYYYKSSELDEQPSPVAPVTPEYPVLAKAQGIEGDAKLLILIDEDGTIHHIEVLESRPPNVFGNAAMAAFRSMIFKPGKKGLMPVKSRMVIKVDFKVEAGQGDGFTAAPLP